MLFTDNAREWMSIMNRLGKLIQLFAAKSANIEADKSCEGQIHRAGILTDYEIQKYKLIPDIATDCLKGATYNLRLGEGHYVFTKPDEEKRRIWSTGLITRFKDKHEPGIWSAVWLDRAKNKIEEINKFNPPFSYAECLTIEPFSAALIQLKETVDTRSCIENHDVLICGRFDLRLSLVAKGLISQQATQVEPKYKGKLFCYLFNQTAEQIRLYYEEEIATIEFSYVSCAIHRMPEEKEALLERIEKSHSKYLKADGSNDPKIFCTKHGIEDVRYFGQNVDSDRRLPDRGSSFNSYIDKRVDDTVRTELDSKLKRIFGYAITSIGIISIIISFFVWQFGNDWAGRHFREKLENIFTKYWQESAPDRDKALREEINKKIDEELKKRNFKQRGQVINEK
jgi:deoxycytidine triphosphate deaminase